MLTHWVTETTRPSCWMSRLHELDVAVPRDLSVVGVDDIPFAAFLGPR
jgi:DNA-binding LacI/PurR family transcriptional regulator